MKEFYKEPFFYYIAVPLLVGIWPLWLWASAVPGAKEDFQDQKAEFKKAQDLIEQILELDPQRLDYAKANDGKGDFDFTVAIDQMTRACRISPSGYRLSTGPERRIKGGQTSQDATMSIEQIEIAQLAEFLSKMQMRWPGLKTTNISISKKRDEKNLWKADLRFTHYQ